MAAAGWPRRARRARWSRRQADGSAGAAAVLHERAVRRGRQRVVREGRRGLKRDVRRGRCRGGVWSGVAEAPSDRRRERCREASRPEAVEGGERRREQRSGQKVADDWRRAASVIRFDCSRLLLPAANPGYSRVLALRTSPIAQIHIMAASAPRSASQPASELVARGQTVP